MEKVIVSGKFFKLSDFTSNLSLVFSAISLSHLHEADINSGVVSFVSLPRMGGKRPSCSNIQARA